MKLHEFDLDAPEVDRAQRQRLRSQSRSITALYERCFEGLAVRRGWKVLLECVPAVTRNEVRDLLGVLTLQVPCELERLWGMDTLDRKRTLLEVLHRGVLAVADAEGWPLEPFEKARARVLANGLANHWWWRKPKWNRSRSLSGQLWCEHELDAFRGWLVVRDKRGVEVARAQVLETDPSEFIFVPKLGDVKWTESGRLALVAQDGSEVGAIVTPLASCR